MFCSNGKYATVPHIYVFTKPVPFPSQLRYITIFQHSLYHYGGQAAYTYWLALPSLTHLCKARVCICDAAGWKDILHTAHTPTTKCATAVSFLHIWKSNVGNISFKNDKEF